MMSLSVKWVCLTSLFISSGLGRTIIQDILLLALSSELCVVLRDTGIDKLYIYEQNSCLVLLNLSMQPSGECNS